MIQTENQNTQEELLIPIDKYLDSLRGHLDVNNRVIFSAKFGDGKTYFLDQFKEKYKEEFLFLTIYPINYQVENNKDIFELIKRDIMFQLFRENIVPDDIDLDAFTSSLFNKENIKEFIDFVGELASVFLPGAKFLSKAVKKGIDAKDSYDEKKISANNFLKKYQDMPGIYEFDVYTRFITEIIEQYKIRYTSKKVVLLIEDLDRIDPEHVFRILNIFSAHIDRKYMYNGENKVSSNKFSLDKVITVCDYQNLQSIYAHFYGASTSFEGYINKFLERPPFQYSVKEAAIDYLYSYIETYCGLTREFCEKVSEIDKDRFRNQFTFTYAINRCSIREIINITDKIDNQIKNKVIVIASGDVSTINSFTRFAVLCKRLNYSSLDFIQIALDSKIGLNILLKCVGIPLLLRNKNQSEYSFVYIRSNKESFNSEYRIILDTPNNVKVLQQNTLNGSSNSSGYYNDIIEGIQDINKYIYD